MKRRTFVGAAIAGYGLAQSASAAPPVKLGIDLFSLRSQNWTPMQLLEYSAKQQAKVVHFSEVRFIGGLDPENLKRVRRRAEELGIEIEIGMKSICPTSKMFDPKAGTAEEQLAHMIDSAVVVGVEDCARGAGELRGSQGRAAGAAYRKHGGGAAEIAREGDGRGHQDRD